LTGDISIINKNCYLNKKYERTGKVFHDRFKSELLEDTERLLSILSFIHNDPVEANVVNEAEQYQWSSYNSYFYNGQSEKCFVSINEQVGEIFIKDYLESKNEILESVKTNWELRYALVRELKEKSNLSIRKIAYLLSLTKGIVQNIK
jgi:putative transposase